MALTKNSAGRMYALTVLTPIVSERLAKLETTLAGLSQPSPFAALTATHFARFVIVPNRSAAGQPALRSLPSPYLLFSATFDGNLGDYLDALCEAFPTDAEEIWGCCEGAPNPARGAPLKTYLEHNQIQTGLFFAAYPDADVGGVRAALDTRERLISLAIRGQAMPPEGLRQAFLEEFPR